MILYTMSQETGLNNLKAAGVGIRINDVEQSSNSHSYSLPAGERPPLALIFIAAMCNVVTLHTIVEDIKEIVKWELFVVGQKRRI